MAETANGIYYEELSGSPSFAGGRDGPKATRKIKVGWSDVDSLLGEWFPECTETGTGWIFPVSISFPGKTYLAALDYTVEPFDPELTSGENAATGVREYPTGAIVTINYGVPPYDLNKRDPNNQGGQVLADYSLAFSAEMLKLGIAGWIWKSDGQPIKSEDASLAKVIPTIEHNLDWKFVPRPPFLRIARMIGCVNSDEALFDAPAETLLFSGAETKRSYTAAGKQAWTMNFKFLQRWVKDGAGTIIGWNHIFRNDIEPARWDRPRYWDIMTPPNRNVWEWAATGWKYLYPAIPFTGLFDGDDSEDT